MRAPAEARRRGAGLLLALMLALALLAGRLAAQDDPDADQAEAWATFASSAEKIVGDPDTPTEELEQLRERLVAQRSEALAAEQLNEPAVGELNQRLAALGPAPKEGAAAEAPEIEALRRDLERQIAEAQAPVLAAQEAYRRADALIVGIDRTVRARFSAELMSRGPSPLLPGVWTSAAGELGGRFADYRAALRQEFSDPAARAQVLRGLPVTIGLIVAGLAVAVVIRSRMLEYVERRLDRTHDRRLVAWLVAVRNLTRLVVPAVGAGLLLAAFDPAGLLVRADEGRFFALPPFALILIGASWLAGSLMAPANKAHRLIPLDDAEAWQATRSVLAMGLVLSLWLVFTGLAVRWDLSATTQSAMLFPLVLVGAATLWRMAGLIELARLRVAESVGDRPDTATASIGLRFLRALVRLLRVIAVVAPLLAAVGFLPAASFLVFRAGLTLGLFGAARVIFDLLNKTAQVFLGAPAASARDDDGLMPVAVAALVTIAALPLLAMIWGARASDIADFWTLMREGVTLGGIRLSASVVLTLIVVFALGAALVRVLQTVLRGTVLPRTRLDAGGKNAVLAGVGYIGFAVAGIAAVSAAGLDLSNLAIVAGALSVGIGFGMQTIVSNFVSGIILLVERPVKEGDWIEVGGFSGYVRGINVRSTEIETFDRASVILPNSDLIAGTVLNRTHKGMSGRLQVPVTVTYDADPKKVEAILLAIAEEHPLVLEEPAPRVLFLELGADSMNFELRCWLRDVNFSLSARSDMNFAIVQRFAAAGIRIQFYGRDLPPAPPAEAPPEPEPEAVRLMRGKQERGAV